MNVFDRYAPFIQDYVYRSGWQMLRGVQNAAGEAIFGGQDNVLLTASTASGKTEAAFFPILTLMDEDPPKSVGALYIAPLKALINDQFGRLTELCEEAGIPVFLISTNTAPDDASFVTKVGTIDKDTTYLAGLWTGEYYADQGINELDAVVFMAADQVHNERRDGYLEGLAAKGIAVNILNTYNGDTREDAMSSCDDALITYPEIDLMITTSAQHGLGAYDACAAASRSEMKIVSMDGEEEEFQKIDEGGIYLCTALQFPGEMSRQTVDLIEQYFDTGSVERFVYTDAGVYCPDGTLSAKDIEQ